MNETLSSRLDGRTRAAREARTAELGQAETNVGGDGEKRTRAVRKPFGTMEQKLSYPVREGYHRHIFNDEDGRIARAIEAGYTHVLDEKNQPINRVVGTAKAGGPLSGYLMEIPQEWYDEDMRAEQKQVNDREQAIKRGAIDAAASGESSEKFYPTAQGRRISVGTR